MSATLIHRYAVTARRWEHGWELYDGQEILTQSATLADAPAQVRDYLATVHDAEPEDFEVTVTADLGGDEADIADTARRIGEVQQESAELASHWRELASRLRFVVGLSVRDTAAVMGISPGRVSQLVDTKPRRRR